LRALGIDYPDTAKKAATVLKGSLCHDFGLNVLYNGQEARAFYRLRAHFNTSGTTGALSIKSYPLSHVPWTAHIFHVGMVGALNDLDDAGKSRIRALLESEVGRIAVESAWRLVYGWPVLSKQ